MVRTIHATRLPSTAYMRGKTMQLKVPETAPRTFTRGEAVVLVPHLNGIEGECEQGLGQLEAEGVRVVRRGGCSAIDVARNELISGVLHEGAESILFIDSDVGFDPAD